MAQNNGQNNSQYLGELQAEKNNLQGNYTHATRLVAAEIDRIQTGGAKGGDQVIDVLNDKQIKLAERVHIPAKEYPKVNFVGRLLGPKGMTLKGLQESTGVKMSILGRGSMKDRRKEEELRKEGGKYSHLNDNLHVLVEVFAPPAEAHSRMAHACYELKKYMDPNEGDEIQQQQMEMMYGEEGAGPAAPPPPQRGRARGGLLPNRGAPRGAGTPRGAPARGAGAGTRGTGLTRGAARGATRGLGGAPTRGLGGAPTRGLGGAPTRGLGGATRGMRGGAPGLRPTASMRPAPQPVQEESYGYEETYQDPYEQTDDQYYDYSHGGSQHAAAATEEYEEDYSGLSFGGLSSGDGWSATMSGFGGKSSGFGKAPSVGRGQTRAHPYSSGRGGMSRY